MANRNFASGGKMYSMHVMPVVIDCNFVVAVSDSAGLGIISLKGPLVQHVYMHSSAATPSTSPGANPASGTIVVQLNDNFNKLYSLSSAIIQSPNSGSDVKIDNSAMTAGVAYVITTLGNASAAKWAAIGVPAGVTPAVGVSFIAASNGGAGNTLTSRVQTSASAGSGVASIEIVGQANLSLSPSPSANQGYGGQIILQCRDYAGSIVAPADGSNIELSFMLSNSSIIIQGE